MSMPPPPDYNQATAYGQPGQYPPQQAGYPPPQAGYPPPQGQYPPPQGQYPPPQGQYPPPQEQYPPSQGQYPPAPAGYAPAPTQYPPPAQGQYGQPTQPTYGGTGGGDAAPKPWEDDTNSNSNNATNEWAGGSFSDKAIRQAFIKKVYLILTAQLSLSVAFIVFFLYHEPTKIWVRQHQGAYWASYGVFLVTYIALACCPSVRRKYPSNFICLFIFTVAFSYMTATITSFYDTNIVLIAAGITAAVCFAISMFAIQTKIDFTMCHGLIFALSMVLFLFGIATIIVYATIGYNYILNCVYGAVAALVFSLFLVYDTQQIVGGRKHEMSPEEYIFGALQLYLDVMYLFLIILSFFGGKGD